MFTNVNLFCFDSLVFLLRVVRYDNMYAFGVDDFSNVKAKIRNYKKRRKKNPKANTGNPATYALGIYAIKRLQYHYMQREEKSQGFLRKK